MKKKVIVSVKNLSKFYPHPLDSKKRITALDNLSFDIYQGQKVGIIGDNGAGKTTLIKIITGIANPSKGSVEVKNKVHAVINIDSGLEYELSGRDNIEIGGLISGYSKKEITEKTPQIIKFADIGDYIDYPVYTYSSGMKFRLAFSIAAHADTGFIVLDESFLVGDMNFQIKTLEKIEKISQEKNKTVIIASHFPLIIRKFCNRFLLISKGGIKEASLSEVANISQKWNNYFSDIPHLKKEEKEIDSPYFQP
jgi:teichoic acid transport system ATP-binding protein